MVEVPESLNEVERKEYIELVLAELRAFLEAPYSPQGDSLQAVVPEGFKSDLAQHIYNIINLRVESGYNDDSPIQVSLVDTTREWAVVHDALPLRSVGGKYADVGPSLLLTIDNALQQLKAYQKMEGILK